MPILDRTAAELPVNTLLSSYTLVPNDVGTELQFSSAIALSANLPALNDIENGFNVIIRNIGAGTLTIDPSGSDLIDGQSTLSLSTSDWHWIRAGQTSWKTIASNSTELSDGSVTTAKLADGSVITAKIANNAVDGTKIAMGSDAQGDILYYNGTDYTRLAVGTSGQVLKTNGSGANPQWVDTSSSSGKIVQVLNTQTTAVSTTSTQMPYDDTIPQNTEGGEFLSLSITPSSASNKLLFSANINGACSTGTQWTVALFQDSTSDALAASMNLTPIVNQQLNTSLQYSMAAGTTSPTTFKIRIGLGASGTFTLNGFSGSRKLGGVLLSSLTITEIEV